MASKTKQPPKPPGKKPPVKIWRVSWCSKTELMGHLQEGLRPTEIANRYHVSKPTVSKAMNHLTLADWRMIYQYKPANMAVVPMDIKAPVDVIGVLNTVLEDAFQMRQFLSSAEGKEVRLPMRVQIMMNSMDMRVRWADSFVRNREKLLRLMSVDQWLQELFIMLDELSTCAACQHNMGLRAALQDKVRDRLMGRHQPVEPVTLEVSGHEIGETPRL